MTETNAGHRTRPRRGWVAGVAATVVAVDVASKTVAVAWLPGNPVALPAGLTLRLTRNPGAAFSIGTNLTPLFTVVAVAVIVGIGWYARRVVHRGWATALGLIAGGALGNLVDRLFRTPGIGRGAVVDFLDLGWWPSFNLADSALFCGVTLALVLNVRNVPASAKTRDTESPGQAADGAVNRDNGTRSVPPTTEPGP